MYYVLNNIVIQRVKWKIVDNGNKYNNSIKPATLFVLKTNRSIL